MKLCLVCGAVVASNEPTCPKCGEASWGADLQEPETKPVVFEQPKRFKR